MKHHKSKIRSPYKAFGGKSYLCRRIIAQLVETPVFLESHCYGASVTLNRALGSEEHINDVNPNVIECFNLIKKDPVDFRRHIDCPYEEEVFDSCSGVENAYQHIIRNRMSRVGLGKDFAWSDRERGGIPGDANGWKTFLDHIPLISKRLENVTTHCVDALKLIGEMSCNHGQDLLVYCDPPYLVETRKSKDMYEYEVTIEHHKELLRLATTLDSKFAISGYRSTLYDEVLDGWKLVEFPIKNHSGQGKTKKDRIECLWMNF